MTDTMPKCQSWWGHHFEGRYSTVQRDTGRGFNLGAGHHAAEIAILVEALKMTDRTYHHDICVRCGLVVHAEPREASPAIAHSEVSASSPSDSPTP
jgi:hypothetical protein